MEHTDEEIVKLTLKKLNIKYHFLVDNESNCKATYIQPMGSKDDVGKLYVNHNGGVVVDLVKLGQLQNFFEFHDGKLASY